MKYFLDAEFIDGNPIDLISIGIVCEDGHQYYAINHECDWSRADDWVQENVLTELPPRPSGLIFPPHPQLAQHPAYQAGWRTRAMIAAEVSQFILPGTPSVWGWYNSSDWVTLYQLFGRMIDLPEHFPFYAKELKQTVDELGNPQIPFRKQGHHALRDAVWIKEAYDWLSVNFIHPAFNNDPAISPAAPAWTQHLALPHCNIFMD